MSVNGHLGMGNPAPGQGGGTRSGGLYVSELQRARLLDAVFAVVAEAGYRGMAVRAVTERAGVSSKTFYDLFVDREDCFLAAFDHGVDRLVARARPVYVGQRDWAARIRGGLGALLGFLDGEPALRALVFVEALGEGPRVLARRAEVLQDLARIIDDGRAGVRAGGELPPLTGEGVVGAAFGVIHARLLQPQLGPLAGLLNPLMATVVLPYRGRAAAARELARPALKLATDAPGDMGGGSRGGPARPLGSGPAVDFRLTVRSQAVLAVVAGRPGLNNQQVSELAGIADQGQISRLMMRLVEQGLVENTRGRGQGAPKAWRLTPAGEALMQTDQGSLQPAEGTTPASTTTDFRLTVLTYKVLTAIGELGGRGSNPSNREVADAAGVRTQGQMSKLFERLEDHGLVSNTGAQTKGAANAWQLTRKGEEVLYVSRPLGKEKTR